MDADVLAVRPSAVVPESVMWKVAWRRSGAYDDYSATNEEGFNDELEAVRRYLELKDAGAAGVMMFRGDVSWSSVLWRGVSGGR